MFFNLFKKKKTVATTEEKLNRMWELWAIGDLQTPVAKLMTYDSEVNNGGHSQYFDNVANGGDLADEVEAVLSILPEPLRGNLNRAYTAFLTQDDMTDNGNDALLEECDNIFYEQEQLLLDILYEDAKVLW